MVEIYTANLLETFQSQAITVALLIGLGVLSIAMVFFGKRGMGSRIVIGAFSLLLIVAGLALAAVTAYQYTGGSKSLTARLSQKQVVESENSEGTGTTQTYRLSFGPVNDFYVPQSVYDKMAARNCYVVTYYPTTSLLEMLGQSTGGSPTKSGEVASIKQDPGAACN